MPAIDTVRLRFRGLLSRLGLRSDAIFLYNLLIRGATDLIEL